MKFDTIRLIGGTVFDLPFTEADPSSPLICLDASGLGPTDKDVTITKTRHRSGIFQNREGALREMTFRIGLNPDWAAGDTVSDLRNLLYSLIGGDAEDQSMMVSFLQDDDPLFDVHTTGWIKRFEPALFSKDPEVNLTIASDEECFVGSFIDQLAVTPSLSKSNPQFNIKGSAPTGMEVQITLTANMASGWQIATEGNVSRLKFEYPFLNGDVIAFSTELGRRYAQVTRSGDVISLLPYLSSDSTWIQLKGAPTGWNDLTISDNHFNWSYLLYTPRYWGI